MFKGTMRNCLEDILNNQLHEQAWNQSSLPVKKGGLGIRMATDLALPAFLSSAYFAKSAARQILPEYIDTESYCELADAEAEWKENLNNNLQTPCNVSVQAYWDEPIQDKKYQDLLDNAETPSEKARLLAVASEHSSDWLNAAPVPTMGLKLDDMTLRIACGLRLGTPIIHPHKCVCGNVVDKTGRHGLSCTNTKGTIPRHQHVNDILKRALGSAQVVATTEPVGLSRNDGKRPDGLTLFPWSRGRCVVWDYTCHDTLAPSYFMMASQEAGSVASEAEKEKFTHYEDLSASYTVVPVGTETLGSWGPSGLKFVKEIGQRIEEHTGDKQSTTHLFQRISMAIQRGNSISIRGTVPDAKSLDEIFYL